MVVAGQWRRVTIPLTAIGIANQSNLTGLRLIDSSGVMQSPYFVDDIGFTQIAPPINLNINANVVRRTVDERLFGLNTATWDGAFNTPATTSILQTNNTRILRFPGGSEADQYHWQVNRSENNGQLKQFRLGY
jgi:hypothetical protein